MSSAADMDRSVQIATFSDNRIRLDLSNFERILDSIGDRPVAIISINGPMRTGKSYMIGHFLRFLTAAHRNPDWFNYRLDNEFHWQSSSERQTTGILMWSRPFYVHQHGREVAVLLMDTQGCFDDKTTTNENNLIFALSCLLSSVLIYNIQNKLSEDILQFLQLFIGFAKMSMEYTSSEAFSKLVFLIRDWDVPREFKFGYYDDFISAGERNYKKEKLNVRDDMVTEVRVVHNEILSSFQSVGCCLMPYPGKELARDDDTSKLDLEFIETIKDFVPRIFGSHNVITKKVGGQEVTGFQFKQIVRKWAKVFENSRIPEVKNVSEATAQTQAMMAYSIALNYYKNEMKVVKSSTGLTADELDRLHDEKKALALDLFRNAKRIKNDKIDKKFVKRLMKEIDEDFEAWREINILITDFKNYKVESQAEKEELEKKLQERIEEVEKKHHEKKRFFGLVGDALDTGLDSVRSGLATAGEAVWGFIQNFF